MVSQIARMRVQERGRQADGSVVVERVGQICQKERARSSKLEVYRRKR